VVGIIGAIDAQSATGELQFLDYLGEVVPS
jgi:hypothetical protein